MIKITAAVLAMAMLFSGPVFAHPGDEACVGKAQLMPIQKEIYKAHSKSIHLGNQLANDMRKTLIQMIDKAYSINQDTEHSSTAAYRRMRQLTGE